jgi:hypothetical protein
VGAVVTDPGSGAESSAAVVTAEDLVGNNMTIARITITDSDAGEFPVPLVPGDKYHVCQASVDEVLAGPELPVSIKVVCAVTEDVPFAVEVAAGGGPGVHAARSSVRSVWHVGVTLWA